MKHLFLAPLPGSFGEALHGIRLAAELCAAGDDVVFLASAELKPVLGSTMPGLRYGSIDRALPRLGEAVLELLAKERFSSLALVDLAAVYKAFTAYGLDPASITHAGVPVIALDAWNLSASGLRWDYGPEDYVIDAERLAAMEVRRRMVPVPFARPEGIAGAYNALPRIPALTAAERARVRSELGMSGSEPLVLWPSAPWQHRRAQVAPELRRLADAVPELVAEHLAALPFPVRILHVGLEPYASAAVLGSKYRHLPPVPKEVFARLLGTADLLLSCNAAATTLGSALAAGLPVLLGTSSARGDSVAAVATAASFPLTSRVADWVARTLPLRPFRAYPLSLYDFLTPVLRDNPCYAALTTVELLDAGAFTAACAALLFDPAYRADQIAKMAQLCELIRKLPSAGERYLSLL